MPPAEPLTPGVPLLTCEVAAVIATMARSPGVARAIESVRAAAGGRDVGVVCVVNDPAMTGTWTDDGVTYLGTGLNLGAAAGVVFFLADDGRRVATRIERERVRELEIGTGIGIGIEIGNGGSLGSWTRVRRRPTGRWRGSGVGPGL